MPTAPRWPFDPRLPLEPRYFREVSWIVLTAWLLSRCYFIMNINNEWRTFLENDPVNNQIYRVTSFMIMLLSTYWTSNVGDIHYILDDHYRLCHIHHKHPNCSQRLSDYWDKVQKSWVGQYLGTILWSIRVMVYLHCSSRSPLEAGYCNFRHVVQLGCILLNPRRWSLYTFLVLKLLFRYHPDMYSEFNGVYGPSRWYILSLLKHRISEIILRTVLDFIWHSVAINYLPCAICDDDWPDMWIATVQPDKAKLAKYQEEHCAHCWMDWAVGDVAAVFKCGHIFHKECNDQWLQLRGSHVCSMCQFRVRYTEERKRPPRVAHSDERILRVLRETDDRFPLWILVDLYLLEIRFVRRERPVPTVPYIHEGRVESRITDVRDMFIAPQNHMWLPVRWPCKGRATGY